VTQTNGKFEIDEVNSLTPISVILADAGIQISYSATAIQETKMDAGFHRHDGYRRFA
jgi:hypothetical protein